MKHSYGVPGIAAVVADPNVYEGFSHGEYLKTID